MVLCSFFLSSKGFGQTSTNGGIYVTADLVAARGDISGLWTWSEANIICNELVDNDFSDWRLPSKEELNFLYGLHSHGSGNFKGMAYWSSTDVSSGYKATQFFHNGNASSGSLGGKYSVRCVRNSSKSAVPQYIGTPTTPPPPPPPQQLPTLNNGGYIVYKKDGHGLVLAPNELVGAQSLGRMDWSSAKTACANLVLNGYSDWRLPTKEELNQLYLFKDKLGFRSSNCLNCGFAGDSYFSSTECNNKEQLWVQNLHSGEQEAVDKDTYKYVRAVRSF